MSPGLHAVLSASASKRWLACPPSARLEEKLHGIFGEKSSAFAEEGTMAHELSEIKLRHMNGEYNDFMYKTMREQHEKHYGAPSKEMERATDDYVDIVMGKLFAAQQVCPDAKLFVEHRLDFSRWVPSGFGTGDASIVSDVSLEVCDLKYGKGVKVDARENPQARYYGLGGINEWGDLYGFQYVRNTIIQPRVNEDPVTEETLTREELLAWGEANREIAEMAWRGQGEFKPGDHCKFCAAKALCAARAAEAMRGFTHGFATPGLIDDSEIPGILAVADIAEAWIKDIKNYARSQAIRGAQWPGYKIVRGRKGNRVWTDEEKVLEQLTRAGLPDEQYMKRGVKSPGEVEKALGKTAFDALLKQYITQPDGALTLVPEDDRRVAVSSADCDFSDMEETNG